MPTLKEAEPNKHAKPPCKREPRTKDNSQIMRKGILSIRFHLSESGCFATKETHMQLLLSHGGTSNHNLMRSAFHKL